MLCILRPKPNVVKILSIILLEIFQNFLLFYSHGTDVAKYISIVNVRGGFPKI